MIKILKCLLIVIGVAVLSEAQAQLSSESSGMDIMQAVQRNIFKEKFSYEELSMILTDELGNRDTRSLRKYTRVNNGNDIKFLMLFDTPVEFHGVGLLAIKQQDSNPEITVYLPAYGEVLRHTSLGNQGETLFGTDFTISELSDVFVGNYRYIRREDSKIGNIDYYIIDVFDDSADMITTSPIMQHYIRQDNLSITRTDYLDSYGILMKQLTMHDLRQSEDNVWHAAMLLMEDRQKDHSTLIKVNKRIISEAYVPDEVFTINWLYENQPPLDVEPTEDEMLETELMNAGNPVLNNPQLVK